MKFALHDFGGKPVKFFIVEAEDVAADANTAAQSPSHHIAVLDVSGSMWGDMASVKSIIEKVFTAEEFNDPSMKISLITYSSNGDCRVHFERVTVEDVLAPNSPHLTEIRNLRVRGLTGMSQSLVAAEKLIDDSEVTCISLHTDGYANDPSPYAEAHSIVAAVEGIEKHPNVFVNTVAYRSGCDFALLSAIANRLSGRSMRANNARDVYKALHAAQTVLAGSMSPVIEAGIGDFDFITFVSKKAKKVIGGTESLTIRGLKDGDDATVYRYREVGSIHYDNAPNPVCSGLLNPAPLLAFARVQMALGNLNAAKYAMISSQVAQLISRHARALVAFDVDQMAADIEGFLFETWVVIMDTNGYGLGETGPSVLHLLRVLNSYPHALRVNVEDLAKSYKRRGLKKVAGKRDDDGNIVPPDYKLQTPCDGKAVQVSSIDINRDTATVNIRLVEEGTLIETTTGNPVDEVQGIKLNLKSYRNYTIVGDGEVNVPVLPLRISDKRLFGGLKHMGLVSGSFDPNKQYDIDISKMPLVDYDHQFTALEADTFETLAKITVLQKILSGLTAGESEALTPEQVAGLKAHYISPALYFSPPTTTPYTDLKVAMGQGEVDTHLSYKVKIGTPEITNLGKLKSGNAYLQRRFTFESKDGKVIPKPKLPAWWLDGTWAVKKLTARTKLDAVDAITFPIYEGFLGLGDTAALVEALEDAHVPVDGFMDAVWGGLDRDECLAVFKEALRLTNNAIDVIYEGDVCPLSFFVGATGLMPEAVATKALTADQLVKAHPDIKLAKAEKEGTFYEAGGLIIGIFTSAEHFSTERGVKVASDLSV